jgi:hypothetical protein
MVDGEMDEHSQRWPTGGRRLDIAAAAAREERHAALRALHVLEFALAAPAPRRQRTWLHRILTAVDALGIALELQIHDSDQTLGVLEEVALCHPDRAAQIERLRDEQRNLRIATAALREQIEPDPEVPIDPADVRARLAALATRYRQHCAREADLIYETTGIHVGGRRSATNDVPA